MAEKTKDSRARVWTIVVYPESAPENWREIIDEEHIAWVEGPLHDKDTNADGTKKKPHWHIVLTFEGKKSYEQIKAIADKLHAPIPQKVESIRGIIRYLIHLDNPEKYQYPKSEIVNHGCDDLDKYFRTASTEREIMKELTEYVFNDGITSYLDLIMYATNQGDDWFDVASQHTIYFTAIVKDVWRKQQTELIQESRTSEADRMSKAMEARNLAKQGLSKAEIADKLGVSRRMIYKYLQK